MGRGRNIGWIKVVMVVVGMLWGLNGYAATRYSVASGNWNATSTWSASSGGASGASVPVTGDIVYIDAYTVTVTATAECASVTFDKATGTLTVNTGITLTVSGQILSSIKALNKTATIAGLGTVSCGSLAIGTDITLGNNTNYTNTLISTISNLSCSGNISIHGDFSSSYKHHSIFSIEGGTVSCNNIQLSTDGNVAVDAQIKNTTGSSTLKIAGTISTSENGANGSQTITLNGANSYVEYNGSASSVYGTSYSNFRISNTSGTVTLGANINVSGTWDNDGTFEASTYIVTFNGSANQSITGDSVTAFGKIYLNNPGFTVTLNKDATATELNFYNSSSTSAVNFSVALAVTLTINGPLVNSSAGNTFTNTLSGAGTINCTSINIGLSPAISAVGSTKANMLTSTISNINCTGDLTILAFDHTSNHVNTTFNLNSGTLQVANVLVQTAIGSTTATLINTGGSQNSILKISGANGITSSGAGTETVNLSGSSASVEFNGTGAQVTGAAFPSGQDITLVINNSQTITSSSTGVSLSQDLTFPSSGSPNLTLTKGLLTTGSYTMKLGSTSTITNGSNLSYVNGYLVIDRSSGSLGVATYPIGKGGRYLPVEFTAITHSSGSTIGLEAFNANCGGSIASSGFCYLSSTEYWKMTFVANAPSNISAIFTRNTALEDLNIITSTTLSGTYNAAGSYSSLGAAATYPTTYSIKNSTAFSGGTPSPRYITFALGSTKPKGGTAIATASSVCSGGSTTITVSGYGGQSSSTGATIQWQESDDNGVTDAWATVVLGSNATTATYTTAALTSIKYYRAAITGGPTGCSGTSYSVSDTVEMTSGPVGGSVTGAATVCSGTNSTSLTLSGNTGSISKWQYSTDNSNWTDIVNVSTSYTATNLSTSTYYRAVVATGGCASSNSSSALVTVRNSFTTGTITTTGETICNGGTPSTSIGSSVAASGGDDVITYSWRSSSDSYVSAISGATSATYIPPSGLTTTTSYRRYANDGTCNTTPSVSTGTWTVTVRTAFTTGTITTTGETICNGGTPSTSIGSTTAASGGDASITYSWRSSSDSYATAISGATSATYTPPSGLTTTTSYRRYANDGTCNTTPSVSTGTWTVTVRSTFTTGEISSTGQTICSGGTPSIIGSTTAASGGDATITYSWRSSSDSYTTAISGATSATYIPPSGLTTTTSYRRYAKDGTCNTTPSVSSGTWTVTVRTAFTTGTITTTGETICNGGTPSTSIGSSVAASGGDDVITYSWRSSSDSYVSVISGATSATYTPPSGLTTTTSYRRYANDGTCNTTPSVSTGTWIVTVRTAFSTGVVSSTGQTICSGGIPSVIGSTTAASGGDASITYSWRSSSDSYVSAISGATSATYTPPSGLTATTSYRRYAKDGTCNTTPSVSTGTWTVTVRSAFTTGEISSTGQTICSGGTPSVIGSTTAASGGDATITYSWRSSSDSYATAISGATSATYTPHSGLTTTTSYRRYAKDGHCNTTPSVSSGTWTVTVSPTSVGGSIAGDAIVCSGTNSTTFTLSGYTGSITKWQYSNDNSIWNDIVNTSTSYTASNLTADTYYRAVITSGVCSSTNSSTATITVANSTYYVSSTGLNTNNGTTSGSSFLTLQKAIDMVGCSPTTIYVAAGAYTEGNITINNKSNISIIGAGIESTIFDGIPPNRFMTISGTSSNISISNLKITDYEATAKGGGFYITTSGTITLTSVHIDNCVLTSHASTETNGGGGIYIASSSTVNIYKSKFTNNDNNAGVNQSAQDGGSILSYGILTLENCLFYDNKFSTNTTGPAGNIYDGDVASKNSSSRLTVDNCTFVSNSNGQVPIFVNTGSGSCPASLVVRNSILNSISGQRPIHMDGCTAATITNSIYTAQTVGSTAITGVGVTNCSTATDAGYYFTNRTNKDYTITASSPCVNAGTTWVGPPANPTVDFNGTTRFGNPDVGCYEAPATVTLGSNPVAAASSCASSLKVPIQSFSLSVTGGTGNLTNVSFTTSGGTFIQSDILNYKIWYGTSNDLSLVASPLATLSPTGGNGTTETFTAFSSPTLSSGSTYYFWITMDVASAAINNKTIEVNAITTTDLTSTTTKSGTTSAGGTQTLRAAPTASAGTTITTCSNTGQVSIVTGASATNNAGTVWTSSGSGSFSSTNTVSSSSYTPSAADITAGSVTLTLTATGNTGCSNATSTKTVNITTLPSATISYAGTPFCSSLSSGQVVTLTGTSGGTYSSTAGLIIDATTGAITPSTSTAGTYTVTYTIGAANGCAAVAPTTSVTVTTLPVASISYAGTPFCSSLATGQAVSLTGTSGGTYSSTAGLIIDATTGSITPSTSTAGTYTVTYTIGAANGCAAVAPTTSVVVTTLPSATISYAGTPFCSSLSSGQAVSLTGTTGGVYSSTAGLTINSSTGAITPSTSTAGNYTVTYTIASSGGCAAVAPTTSVTVTTLPVASISYAGTPFCSSLSSGQVVTRTGTSGGTYSSTAGLIIDASTGAITPSTSTAGTYTVTYTIGAANGCAAVAPTTSVVVTTLPSATISYAGTPFNTNQGSGQAVTLTGTSGGGFSSTSGLTINSSTGAITPNTSSIGTYVVTYSIASSGGCSAVNATTSVVINSGTTTFYYTGSGTINSTSSWTSNANGSTTSAVIPTAMNGDGYTFYILHLGSNANPSFSGSWTLGTGSKIVVGDGTNSVNFTLTGTSSIIGGSIEVANNGTLTIMSTSVPTLGTLASGSSVNFNGSGLQTIPAGTYGNVLIENAAGASAAGTLLINGNLTLTDGAFTPGASLTIAGNIIDNGGTFTHNNGTVTFTGNSSTIGGTDASEAFYNVVVNKTSGQTLSMSGSMATLSTQDFTLTSGTFSAPTNLAVSGNLYNNGGTFTHYNGTVTLSGASKTLGGTSSSTFYNLTVNGATTLGISQTVNNIMGLGAKVTLGSTNLTIGSNGYFSGYSSDNFIVTSGTGKVIQNGIQSTSSVGKQIFPIGTVTSSGSVKYTPCFIENAGVLDNFSVYVAQGRLANGTLGSAAVMHAVDRTWFVEEGTSGGSDVTLTLQWNTSEELNNFTRLLSFVSHYTGGAWDSKSQTPQSATPVASIANAYSISRSGLNSFSPFGVEDPSALPIELLYFKAEDADSRVRINWATGTELNCDYFDVQRSVDGQAYVTISTVKGVGDSKIKKEYVTYDSSPLFGISYYRLKQVDIDGVYTLSDWTSINRGKKQSSNQIRIYPNPISDNFLHIEASLNASQDVQIKLIDALGKVIHQQKSSITTDNNKVDIDVANVLVGVYFVEITDSEGQLLDRIKIVIKNK
jgi:hypothetical protein